MRVHGASRFVAIDATAVRRHQWSWSAPESRGAVSGCRQLQNATPRRKPAHRPESHRGAIRGSRISPRTTAVQFVVRTSRGSAAPGSQRVVVSGARSCGAGGASGGTRTSQQPKFMPQRHNAGMASVIKSNASRAQNAWPNPAVNRTPCGSPRLAFISFWAMRGLPQGAGYLVR